MITIHPTVLTVLVAVFIFICGLAVSGLIAWGMLISKVGALAKELLLIQVDREKRGEKFDLLDGRVTKIETTCPIRETSCSNTFDSIEKRLDKIDKRFDAMQVDIITAISQTIDNSMKKVYSEMQMQRKK
jgi:hypothetical protein